MSPSAVDSSDSVVKVSFLGPFISALSTLLLLSLNSTTPLHSELSFEVSTDTSNVFELLLSGETGPSSSTRVSRFTNRLGVELELGSVRLSDLCFDIGETLRPVSGSKSRPFKFGESCGLFS